jgi:hypothetical protein
LLTRKKKIPKDGTADHDRKWKTSAEGWCFKIPPKNWVRSRFKVEKLDEKKNAVLCKSLIKRKRTSCSLY